MCGGYMPEIRVTINENVDSYLDKIVASGLYPSKAELMRCGMVHLLKELNLIQNLINTNEKTLHLMDAHLPDETSLP
jgi:Arc/MetJ-type ribon-helix-helix transcriptional regulator